MTRLRAKSNTSVRYSIADSNAKNFIANLSNRYNLTLSFTAQLIIQSVVEGRANDLNGYFEEKVEMLTQLPEFAQKRIKTYTYKNIEYSRLEMRFLARMVEQFKFDTINYSYLNVKKALADEFSMKIVRSSLIKFQENKLIIVSGNTRSRTMTLLNESFMLVNKAIDDGYLT